MKNMSSGPGSSQAPKNNNNDPNNTDQPGQTDNGDQPGVGQGAGATPTVRTRCPETTPNSSLIIRCFADILLSSTRLPFFRLQLLLDQAS